MRVVLALRDSRPRSKYTKNEDVTSLARQDSDARPVLERAGHEVVAVTTDTVSSKTMLLDRKNIGAFLTDPLKLASVDGIAASHMSRLSRGSDVDFTEVKAWALDNKKTLLVVNGSEIVQFPARPGTIDDVLWALLERQVREEWKSTHDRLTGHSQSLLHAGRWVGEIPLGIKLVKGVPETDQTGSKAVGDIITWCSNGSSLRDIGSRMETEHGISRSAAAIKHIIMEMDSYATGKWTRSCEGASFTWELAPVVTWDNLSKARSSMTSRKTGGDGSNARRWLSGLVWCDCGGRRIAVVRRGRDMLRCGGSRSERRGCGAPAVPLAEVERTVNNVLSADFDQVHEWVPNDSTERIESCIRGLKSTRNQLAELRLDTSHLDQAIRDTHCELKQAKYSGMYVNTGRTAGDTYKTLCDDQARRRWMLVRNVSVIIRSEEWQARITVNTPECQTSALKASVIALEPVKIGRPRKDVRKQSGTVSSGYREPSVEA